MSASNPDQYPCKRARKEIWKRSVSTGAAIRDQHFYPWDQLLNYFQEDHGKRLRDILLCSCRRCKEDDELFDPLGRPIEYIDKIIGAGSDPDWRATAVSLFALTVYIGHPRFITPFLHNDHNDSTLENYGREDTIVSLLTDYWSEYKTKDADDFERLKEKFVRGLPLFAVPRLDSSTYRSWEKGRILPFVNQEELGTRLGNGDVRPDGANGRVFSFEIYEGYRQFTEYPHIEKFVRKEIKAPIDDLPLFTYLEKHALDKVGILSHPHIVKMIKPYKLGDKYNIIFPCAMTNLHKYLRQPQYEAASMRQGPIEASPFWKQMCGIVDGLSRIHHYGKSRTNSTPQIDPANDMLQVGSSSRAPGTDNEIGFHFDLKPANILVEEQGTCVISDFGQATFKSIKEQSTSRTHIDGGTDVYAPPEINSSDSIVGRSYDIWSLGCILLEVVTFIIKGHDGLTSETGERGLDHVRNTDGFDRRDRNFTFYSKEEGTGEWIMKPEVEEFMKELRRHMDKSSSKRQKFTSDVLDLIRRMLSPKPEKRPEASTVLQDLELYLKSVNDRQRPAQPTRAPPLDSTEKEVASRELSSISDSGLFQKHGEDWEKVRLRVLQSTHTIEMINVSESESHTERRPLGQKSAIVPYFEFPSNRSSNNPAISFIEEISPNWRKVPRLDYFFTGGDIRNSRQMLSILTGQSITSTHFVKDLTIRQHRNAKRHFVDVLTRAERLDFTTTVARVQLWRESDATMPPQLLPNSSRISRSQNAAPLGRVVLYGERSIYLFPILKDMKVKHKPGDHGSTIDDDPRAIKMEFVPLGDTVHYFRGLEIKPWDEDDTNGSYASIPLDQSWLRRLQDGDGPDNIKFVERKKFTSVQMTFSDRRKAVDFYDDYMDAKEEERAPRVKQRQERAQLR